MYIIINNIYILHRNGNDEYVILITYNDDI